MSPAELAVAAAITAGGRSRRFGSDKALALSGGVPLLERVAASLAGASPRLLVAPAGRYALPGWRPLPDTRPGEGPLAGLEAALLGLLELEAVLPGTAPEWLAFAAVDLPHLSPAYWAQLVRALPGAGATAPQVQAVCGQDGAGRWQPLAALYHRSALPAVTRLLDAGERRMGALLDALELRTVPWSELAPHGPDVYRNANHPADLQP